MPRFACPWKRAFPFFNQLQHRFTYHVLGKWILKSCLLFKFVFFYLQIKKKYTPPCSLFVKPCFTYVCRQDYHLTVCFTPSQEEKTAKVSSKTCASKLWDFKVKQCFDNVCVYIFPTGKNEVSHSLPLTTGNEWVLQASFWAKGKFLLEKERILLTTRENLYYCVFFLNGNSGRKMYACIICTKFGN